MKVLDLFSGIGGFSLGLERAGFETVAFCEVDAKARMVLKKHWPGVKIYEDVKELTKKRLDSDGFIQIDVICGGFPCQDISTAGKGAGLSGERSGLWREYKRLIEEIRPRYAIIENVSALRSRGLDEVLWSLTEIGYDAEWHCIPACAIGAPHRRDRVWLVAYASGIGLSGSWEPEQPKHSAQVINREAIEFEHGRFAGFWSVEPAVGRVANGVPGRVDRLKQLGNAVVPQIPELIGRAIIQFESSRT